MLITALDRVRLLSILPKGGTVAEVGVLRGSFSLQIKRIVAPETLHLIDPWGRDEEPNAHYAPDLMREAMDTVESQFRDDIAAGRVVLHRDFSTKIAPAFPEHSLDWVYIDGQHDYANARADLLAFKDKVKPDGFILGHDFSAYRKFGVVPAVREFTDAEGFDLVLATNETNATYLLARSGNDTSLPALRERLLDHEGGWPIEIDDALLDHYEQVPATNLDGRRSQMGYVMRFGSVARGPRPPEPDSAGVRRTARRERQAARATLRADRQGRQGTSPR